MSSIEIYVNKLTANYTSSFHFKIKIVLNSSPYRETAENKHSFKYEKGASKINIYEKLILKTFHPLTSESKLQFFLEVYTKSGYKTAGIGVFHLSKGVFANVPFQIEIQKCPLGKGKLEIQFENFNLKPSLSAKKINIPIRHHLSNHKSSYSNNSYSYNNQEKSIISNNSYITNLTNIDSISSDNNSSNSPKNVHKIKNNNNSPYEYNNIKKNYISKSNDNDEIIKEKDRQIIELHTKINYYEEENTELKNLLKDFKKEKKTLIEEKNILLNQEKEKLQKALNEKDDLQVQNASLQQNITNLKNNKNESDKKAIYLKNQTDKQIKNMNQQIQNLNKIKLQLENENKSNEEKIIELDRKYKEMVVDYQKKLSDLNDKYSSEKNNNILNYNKNLKLKEEEIAKLNIKIKSMEENIISLNEIIELNNNHKNEKEELTENMKKLLVQISSKDKQIFDLKKEVIDLSNKIITDSNDRKTQNMIKVITEKDLKNKIYDLENIINEKDNELIELRTKYENIKYNSNKLNPKIQYIEESYDEKQNGNNELLITQIQEIQKVYKEREEKLLKEKDEEINKLKMKNTELIRGESYLGNNNNSDIKKYIKEIDRLKTINNILEGDLGYYKELNNKFMDNEKRTIEFETENIRLQTLLQQKNDEVDSMEKKYKKLEEENIMLEKQLVNSKGKLGEVLNELAEAETKCVYLEEEKRQIRKDIMNGGKIKN